MTTEDQSQPNNSSFPVSVNRARKLFPQVTWHPSREVWERAAYLYADVDLGKVVVEYIQKNHRNKHARPDEDKWLSWVAQAQKQHDEAALRIKADQARNERPATWHSVAD